MKTEIQHKIDKINIMLENAMLKLNFMIVSGKAKSLIQLGEGLVSLDSDKYTNGGFWLWDYIANEIFYSPLFCTSFLLIWMGNIYLFRVIFSIDDFCYPFA